MANAGAALHGTAPVDPTNRRHTMNPIAKTLAGVGISAGLCLAAASALAQGGPPPQILPEGIRGGSEVVPEKGVEIRKYLFKETGEELPYSVFVSSKVK